MVLSAHPTDSIAAQVTFGSGMLPENWYNKRGQTNLALLWKRYLLGLPALTFYIVEEIAENYLESFKKFIAICKSR